MATSNVGGLGFTQSGTTSFGGPSTMGLVAGMLALTGLAAPTLAAQSVSLDLTGVQIRNATNQTRTSAPATIDPAFLYSYEIQNATVRGVGGVMGLLFPNPVPLAQVFQTLGQTDIPTSALIANPSGTIPATLLSEAFSGSTVQLGVTFTFAATFATSIDAAGVVSYSISSVVLTSSNPFLQPGYLQFSTGTVVVSTQCVGDFDLDGGITPADVSAFFTAFEAGDPTADIDVDGGITPADVAAFFERFEAGC